MKMASWIIQSTPKHYKSSSCESRALPAVESTPLAPAGAPCLGRDSPRDEAWALPKLKLYAAAEQLATQERVLAMFLWLRILGVGAEALV